MVLEKGRDYKPSRSYLVLWALPTYPQSPELVLRSRNQVGSPRPGPVPLRLDVALLIPVKGLWLPWKVSVKMESYYLMSIELQVEKSNPGPGHHHSTF